MRIQLRLQSQPTRPWPLPGEQPESRKITIPDLAPDDEVPAEVLEFFVPEVEEHMQTVTDCLLSLEANPNPEDIHRLFRAMHTIKGSAAQVGLHRISRVAHRAEDLVGRLRDGQLRPSASIVDICLESVDIMKKFLYSQWPDDAAMQSSVKSLLTRIAKLAPEEQDDSATPTETYTAPQAVAESVAAVESTEVVEQVPLATLPTSLLLWWPKWPLRTLNPNYWKGEIDPAIARKSPSATPQSKSVRISLERLDRMMNAVGELVINRTRMLGRVAELERLADVLNFSKARMSDKIGEFQEKYEFNQIPTTPRAPSAVIYADIRRVVSSPDTAFGGSRDPFRSAVDTPATRTPTTIHWPSSAIWKWTVTTSSTFFRAR